MDREKLIEIELINQQGGELQAHLQNLESQSSEITNVISALADFTESKVGDEVLIPLTNGIFAKATLSDNAKLLVNVGDNTVVEKSVDATASLLAEQKHEIEEYRKQATLHFQRIIERLSELKEEIRAERKKELEEKKEGSAKKR